MYMVVIKAKCKICHVETSGDDSKKEDAAREAIRWIEDHIDEKHCDSSGDVEAEAFDSVGSAWELV